MSKTQKQLSSSALREELTRIADWWTRHALDEECGGFHGEIRDDCTVVSGAPRALILNTRILWFFSELYRETGLEAHLNAARWGYEYLATHFIDREFGGLYWEVGPDGAPETKRKQTYGQAFGVYALAAYYRASGDQAALRVACDIFQLMETHCKDPQFGGYLEGFTQEWSPLDDMRLSEVDANFPKSMNNHLHVLEAYTGLYQVSGDASVGRALAELTDLFADRIVGANGSMTLFFNADWSAASTECSFGHDIEASWLLLEAAMVVGDPSRLAKMQELSSKMARRCLSDGMAPAGYVMNELHGDGTLDATSPWWVQAEAMVGFLFAYRATGEGAFMKAAQLVWEFVQIQHLDFKHGEWLWGARQDKGGRHRHYKAGPWKGPYHNGRSMIECARVLDELDGAPDAGSHCASKPSVGVGI